MNITAYYDPPPIPTRNNDWRAIDADTYDADCDEMGYFSHSPVGYGRTKEEAIADLEQQLLELVEEVTCEHGVAPGEYCEFCDRAPMAMLPNDHHPGAGCSCGECLRIYPSAPR